MDHNKRVITVFSEKKNVIPVPLPDSDLYTIIKVVRDEDLYQQIGRDIYLDLVDHDKVRSFRVINSLPFNHFKIGQLDKKKTQAGNWELVLLLEGLELGPDLCTFHLRNKTEEDILLFFKLYNPEKGEIRYVGKLFVNHNAMAGDILKKLNDMANFAPDDKIELYEEMSYVQTAVCELIVKERTFLDNSLEDGGIICFQKAHPVEKNCRYPDVPSFLGDILRCQELPKAKLKVIVAKVDLEKAEGYIAPLQIRVFSLKRKLNELEEYISTLQIKAMTIVGDLKEAEENMASLELKLITMKDELKEAEESVTAFDAIVNP